MQKARRQPVHFIAKGHRSTTACKWVDSGSFHSPPGVLFSFRSRYYSLSVSQEYLALECGHPRFTQDFTSLALLRYPLGPIQLRVRGYHPLWPTFPGCSTHLIGSHITGPTTPESKLSGLGSGVFARRYWRHLIRFLLLRLLRCFNSPGLASACADHGGYPVGLPHSDIPGS